ncbi:MAG: hypothetical protein IKS85_05825 [Lachnospiraceae bacterium]|nr:hypothetical protein [Lachnospiraceae bacterium]
MEIGQRKNNMELAIKLLKAFIIILTMMVTATLSTVIHEFGHFIMGKLIGYEFVSFRIGPLAIMRKNGKLRFTIQNSIVGTGGQCIMLPPESKEPEKVPAVPYHLGGGLFNLLTVLLALPPAILATNKFVRVFFILLAAFSAGLALINLIPLKFTVPNDGYNVKLILTSKADRIAIYKLLRMDGLRDRSPAEFLTALFDPREEEGEYGRVMKLFRGSFLQDVGDFEKAEQIFAECSSKELNDIPYYRLEASCERLFCMILRGAAREEIDQVYDEELKKYFEKTKKGSVGKRRILYALYKCVLRDEAAARQELAEAERLLRKCSSRGEAKMEAKLLERVKNMQITL